LHKDITFVEINYGKVKGYTENNLPIIKGISYDELSLGDLLFLDA